jgi:hypothetical protein
MIRTFTCGILALLFAWTITGCKKQIDQAKADAVVEVMVANKWIVQQYIDGTNNVTADFDGFDFQFYRDNTVVGANTTISKTGTWSGNASNQTISANFTNAPAPLSRLNGTWTISSYDSNGPKFSQFINGVEMKLVLRKK